MTNGDKNLLLKDLCARLPYNLYIRVEELNVPKNEAITEGFIGNYLKDNRCNDYDAEGILNELADGCIDVKPYLRPLSSMTEEEFKEYHSMLIDVDNSGLMNQRLITKIVDWLDERMFDHRNLVPKGLALEAKEGMY